MVGSKHFSHRKGAKIQDVRLKMCFFLYNSKCIHFKSHKCIEVEYELGHSEDFGTKYMLVSITVLEIQHKSVYSI